MFNPAIAPDKKNFFFTSSEVHFGERHFYKMANGSRDRIKLTSMPGNNDVTPSPDGSRLAIVYSYSNKPLELYVDGKKLTDSPAEGFKKYPWGDPEIVMVPARDGAPVPARLFKSDCHQRRPAVIFVHGSGYLQNVHKYWRPVTRANTCSTTFSSITAISCSIWITGPAPDMARTGGLQSIATRAAST